MWSYNTFEKCSIIIDERGYTGIRERLHLLNTYTVDLIIYFVWAERQKVIGFMIYFENV